jgi:type IV pilus assembly protein PilQ
MNGFVRLLLVMTLSLTLVRCATSPDADDSPAVEEASDFSEFDNSEAATASSTEEPAAAPEASLEEELNQAEGAPQQQAAAEEPKQEASPLEDEFAQFENEQPADQVAQQEPPPPVVETPIEPPPPEVTPEVIPPPVVETAPPPEVPAETTQQMAQIKNIRYKANDNGGTVLVEADQPLTYETRLNADTNQYVIEIPNAKLPDRLKRPYNTKDMTGGIGSVDAYQNKGATTARIVVQLRSGVTEPTIQSEGNSLLVVQSGGVAAVDLGGGGTETAAPPQPEVAAGSTGSAVAAAETAAVAAPSEEAEADSETTEETVTAKVAAGENKILSSASLEEFMSGNTQFYGKPISLEVSEMDIREVFKLIGEESGVNMVLSDEVKGTISLKLREVPWDQVLIVIMKAKKLGYTRSGSILRIDKLDSIKDEEKDTLRMISERKAQAPLKVRVMPVSYAKIDDVATQARNFVSERGKVVGDVRTSSLIMSDHDENIERMMKLIAAIDVPPPQVLIEGKIVEASDQFQRQIGINWSATGQESRLFNSNKIRGKTQIGISPTAVGGGASTGALTFTMGTIDVLGDLQATLALYEQQSAVKVLSSPRIVTLHNEAAEINQSIQIPLITQAASVNSTTPTAPTVTFKDVALRLAVTPQITNDASVIMAVEVKREFAGSVVEQTSQARPINTRSAKTKVMVRNSQTAVIGGIYQSDQTLGEAKVPWVGDIPILGWLFKNRNSDSSKNELLIFLTPRILGQADSQAIPSNGVIE